jgi:hypothetical protein
LVSVETASSSDATKVMTYRYVVHAPTAEQAERDVRTFYQQDQYALLPIVQVIMTQWEHGNVLPWTYGVTRRSQPDEEAPSP